MGDPLFAVKNNFYLGAFNAAINDAAELPDLNEIQAVDRDVLVYRSYIALGSYEVRTNVVLQIIPGCLANVRRQRQAFRLHENLLGS